MEKEREGKERFFCKKKKKSDGLLIKHEARPHSRRKCVGSGLGDRKEAGHLDQPLRDFKKE